MTYSNRWLHPMWHRCYPPDYKPARHLSTVNDCCLQGTARSTPYDCSAMRSRVSAVATARGNDRRKISGAPQHNGDIGSHIESIDPR